MYSEEDIMSPFPPYGSEEEYLPLKFNAAQTITAAELGFTREPTNHAPVTIGGIVSCASVDPPVSHSLYSQTERSVEIVNEESEILSESTLPDSSDSSSSGLSVDSFESDTISDVSDSTNSKRTPPSVQRKAVDYVTQ
jgi:hypothetical protein